MGITAEAGGDAAIANAAAQIETENNAVMALPLVATGVSAGTIGTVALTAIVGTTGVVALDALYNKLFNESDVEATGSDSETGGAFPDRPLPRDEHGNPLPESDEAHTQLGTKDGSKGKYPQAREFDANGNPVRDIDFTDHGRADHPNPHQHDYLPNETGGTPKRGPTKPLEYP